MTFIWPQALLALLLVPVLVGVYIWIQRRRSRYAVRFASVAMVRQAIGKGPGIRRHIPAAIYLLALAGMIVALARPQATISVPRDTGTLMLVLDVSGSMQATDVKPNRMEATKAAAAEFVERQPSGVKIGVVSFSDFGALVQAPTRDKEAVVKAIDRLRPQRGTNIGGGLQAALDALYEGSDAPRPSTAPSGPAIGGQATPPPSPSGVARDSKVPPASVVLVSDGESNVGPPPLDVAQEAAQAGVKVYTIGIGTKEGVNLNIQGRRVFTRLDEDSLRGMAELTAGRYLNAQNESELRSVYDELSREREFEKEETEITFGFTAGALALSLIGGILSLLWFNRLP
ncbi:MAG: VWA domain-containing protein [Dehalococcoidia bacterium]